MIKDEQFMQEAIKEAKLAVDEGNWPMGCVIVLNGEIIARAHNTGYADKNRMAHAEIKALTEAKDTLEQHRGEATLYSTYEPCPMCFGAIVLNKIRRVVTGIDLDESGCLNLQDHLPPFFQQSKFHFEITRGVMPNECRVVYMRGKMVDKHLEQLSSTEEVMFNQHLQDAEEELRIDEETLAQHHSDVEEELEIEEQIRKRHEKNVAEELELEDSTKL